LFIIQNRGWNLEKREWEGLYLLYMKKWV
jgi:hypothetical protein